MATELSVAVAVAVRRGASRGNEGMMCCFGNDPHKNGYERMGREDAEKAVYIALMEENPTMTEDDGKKAAAEFIKTGRSVELLVEVRGRKGQYIGSDPYKRSWFRHCWD